MEFFRIKKDIPFMRYAPIFNVISLLTFVVAVFFISYRGLNLSVEFTGGTQVEVGYTEAVPLESLRQALSEVGYSDALVQNIGNPRDVLIRLPNQEDAETSSATKSSDVRVELEDTLKKFEKNVVYTVKYAGIAPLESVRKALADDGYPNITQVQNPRDSARTIEIILPKQDVVDPSKMRDKIEGTLKELENSNNTLQSVTMQNPVRKVEFVGPQVGKELASDGAMALLFVVIGIVLYLALRFEWRFAVSTIIANMHDAVIILGFFAFFQWEFSLPVLAAVLAVVGYSVNESVVVFDRVRETFRKRRDLKTVEVINHAITRTISRTVITHGSTQMMVLSMLFFGGAALHYFALALTIGICFGIYSSVLVASPLAMWLGVSREQFAKVKAPKQEAVV